MNAKDPNYKSIDVSQLVFTSPISMKDALADVSPMEWSESVKNGERTVIVRPEKEEKESV